MVGGRGEVGRRPAARRVGVVRAGVGVDGLALDAVLARGEELGEDDLTSVTGRGGALGPAATLREVEVEVMVKGRKGPGAEGAVVRAQSCEGAGGDRFVQAT